MTKINENDEVKCEVCRENKPVCIPLIICAHRHNFCERCIKCSLSERRHICPKCRAILPVNYYLRRTNQQNINIFNVSLTRWDDEPPTIQKRKIVHAPVAQNNYRPSTVHNIPSLSTFNCLADHVFTCCSVGLLIGLIIYPVIKQV